jgi:hypothetical protein
MEWKENEIEQWAEIEALRAIAEQLEKININLKSCAAEIQMLRGKK